MSQEEEESFKSEMAVLRKLDHPNILKLYEVFEDQKKGEKLEHRSQLRPGGRFLFPVARLGRATKREAGFSARC